MGKKLLIISQIGSPEKPKPQEVGQYLRRFLMDKRILDIPWFFRWILVNIGIVPRRRKPSAEKYHNIWTRDGSPLVVETKKFAHHLGLELKNTDIAVHWRYGELNAYDSLKALKSEAYDEILVAPMYPQYAMATTESAYDVLLPAIEKIWPHQKNVKRLKPFYNQPAFINAWVKRIKPYIKEDHHLLFSFHGLPVSQIQKISGCELNACCDRADIANCYYAQCKRTVKLLAEQLGLASDKYTLCFQSRVGPKKWLEPATEKTTEALVKGKNIKKLVVACPAFVTDGLETLEEINIELQHSFKMWGGEEFLMTESLNHDPEWIKGFANLVHDSESWDQNHS